MKILFVRQEIIREEKYLPTEWKCIFGRIFPSFWLKVMRVKKERNITLEKRRNTSFKLH